MPFVQRFVEPKFLSRTQLFDDDGNPKIGDFELEAVTNNTLCNALRQLASLVLAANDIFENLGGQLEDIKKRSEVLKVKIGDVEGKVQKFDPKEVTVPESDIGSFSLIKTHFKAKHPFTSGLFTPETRPLALRSLYETATKTPVHLMRQLDRWRRDGYRSSRFFLCTPVLGGAKRRRIKTTVDIDIETSMPAAIEDLRRWTSNEALGDITVTPDCASRITSTVTDGNITDGTIGSDDEAIDHKLPSPEEQLQVIALKFPAEIVAVDITGRSFDRMSSQRRSLVNKGEIASRPTDGTEDNSVRRKSRNRRTRSRRRNTLAGTDQKEIRDALTAGEEPSSPTHSHETDECSTSGAVSRSRSSDILRSSKRESPETKKSHFNTLKQWGKSRYDKLMNKSSEGKPEIKTKESKESIDDINLYETVTMKRKRDLEKERRTHERNSSISSSEKSSINIPVNPLSQVMNIAVKLRDSSTQRRLRRLGNKDEPHSSSGNWSASSESGRASIGSEITSTTHPKSTTSAATSSNSLYQQLPSSVNSRRRYNINMSASGSVTSEGTLTPDIIHDLHEDGETSSVYSCDTEGYYTSFHMDSGLKTLKEEDTPPTPLHSTSALLSSGSNNTVLSAESEYELFGKGSTSTTTSSAGTVCTTLRAGDSNKSLIIGPAVPERKSSLSKLSNKSNESSLERDFSDKTGTVKRSPATAEKPVVVAVIHKGNDGDISPDSGHNTSSSPIESISSPNGIRSNSDFEFSESSDMEGPERIERIRVKTTINSSRIPSMCVITPQHSDDESENSSNSSHKNYQKQLEENNAMNKKGDNIQHIISTTVNGTNKLSLVNVNPCSGYATVERIDQPDGVVKSTENKSVRAPSPSGGSVTVKEVVTTSPPKPIIKASLLPLNNMFGRIKSNIVSFAQKRDRSKSPSAYKDKTKLDEGIFDAGEYVTIADVRNNNQKSPIVTQSQDNNIIQDIVNKNLTTVLSGKIRETEYVSLNELPCNENNNTTINNADSLERKRQGARVILDAEGKVVYSSDSLRRRKGAHTTFEPGKNVKPSNSPSPSPLPIHRTIKTVRPVTNSHNQMVAAVSPIEFNRPLSPQTQIVIKASSGTAEIVRKPPATIVTAANTPTSPKASKGAYVNMQDAGKNFSAQEKDGVQSQTSQLPSPNQPPGSPGSIPTSPIMYRYGDQLFDMDTNRYISSQYYMQRGPTMYSTLPTRKTQFFTNEIKTERSVTPDITRGLERNQFDQQSNQKMEHTMVNQRLGIPVRMPDINRLNLQNVPLSRTPQKYESQYYLSQHQQPYPYEESDSLKISPIDPRNSAGFQSSTPSGKELKAATNLENKMLSPKKSTMTNDELYAVIHKSKKKMNIKPEESPRSAPVTVQESSRKSVKSPETGYIGDKSKSRLSWSPSKGEYIDFNEDIDKLSPPNDSRSRQSWACGDRKPKPKQTSTLDFKRLLLQKSSSNSPKKLSAVEQLKISKQQPKPQQPNSSGQPEMNILDLSASPRSLVNRKFLHNPPGSPNREQKPLTKVLSPRSQWRFASPRSDVLSSPILEDCREDDSPNNSSKKRESSRSGSSSTTSSTESSPKGMPRLNIEPKPYTSATQRLYAQRAQYFNPVISKNTQLKGQDNDDKPPTLETAF